MTLEEVKVLRDKYYTQLTELDLNQLNHSIDGASYDHDSHRDSLQKSFEFYDNLYNKKSSAGSTKRLDKKAV